MLFKYIKEALHINDINYTKKIEFLDFRDGDVRHSQAQILKANNKLGYDPEFNIVEGIKKAMPWYIKSFKKIH